MKILRYFSAITLITLYRTLGLIGLTEYEYRYWGPVETLGFRGRKSFDKGEKSQKEIVHEVRGSTPEELLISCGLGLVGGLVILRLTTKGLLINYVTFFWTIPDPYLPLCHLLTYSPLPPTR